MGTEAYNSEIFLSKNSVKYKANKSKWFSQIIIGTAILIAFVGLLLGDSRGIVVKHLGAPAPQRVLRRSVRGAETDCSNSFDRNRKCCDRETEGLLRMKGKWPKKYSSC